MSIFQKKPKKSPEELRKEAEAKIAETSNKLRVQIALLEKKKETLLRKNNHFYLNFPVINIY